jgi:aspartyl-tRNA(Asn)/glutamyl-tRNA(Gln) amidotransferase subunit B
MNARYEAIIGLEVHAQMLTNTKAFCGCSTEFGADPNSNVCPVCLGMPGVLPVLNKNLVEFVVKVGLATHCKIAPKSTFARKNYFYPDLPKGYQISQYEEPICYGGFVQVDLDDGTRKHIGLTRIHMEEDAGKSIHDIYPDTLVDVNRCGVPLIEIVSEPDIRAPREAYLYLTQIKQIVTYLGVCDGNMEEGSLRCDANVSVRMRGETKFGTKTEVKNMNSFRNVEKALEYEINRQIEVTESGGLVRQDTLLWDADQGVAVSMRSKEEAHDYRYFPEPDLVPVYVHDDWVKEIGKTLPELPMERRDRFMAVFGLPKYDADILTMEKSLGEFYEQVVKFTDDYKAASNWVMVSVMGVMNEQKIKIDEFPIMSKDLADLINMINDGTISGKIAKDLFEEMLRSKEAPRKIVEKKGWIQVTDEGEVDRAVSEVIATNPDQLKRYLSGKEQLFGFFVGQIMKLMQGKGNPKMVNDVLRKKLNAMK